MELDAILDLADDVSFGPQKRSPAAVRVGKWTQSKANVRIDAALLTFLVDPVHPEWLRFDLVSGGIEGEEQEKIAFQSALELSRWASFTQTDTPRHAPVVRPDPSHGRHGEPPGRSSGEVGAVGAARFEIERVAAGLSESAPRFPPESLAG